MNSIKKPDNIKMTPLDTDSRINPFEDFLNASKGGGLEKPISIDESMAVDYFQALFKDYFPACIELPNSIDDIQSILDDPKNEELKEEYLFGLDLLQSSPEETIYDKLQIIVAQFQKLHPHVEAERTINEMLNDPYARMTPEDAYLLKQYKSLHFVYTQSVIRWANQTIKGVQFDSRKVIEILIDRVKKIDLRAFNIWGKENLSPFHQTRKLVPEKLQPEIKEDFFTKAKRLFSFQNDEKVLKHYLKRLSILYASRFPKDPQSDYLMLYRKEGPLFDEIIVHLKKSPFMADEISSQGIVITDEMI